MRHLRRWMLGTVAAVMLAGATIPAGAQVIVHVGPHHRYHHHHHHYRHGRRY